MSGKAVRETLVALGAISQAPRYVALRISTEPGNSDIAPDGSLGLAHGPVQAMILQAPAQRSPIQREAACHSEVGWSQWRSWYL